MGMARTVDAFLGQARVPCDLLAHPHTMGSPETLRATRLPGHRLAKGVVLRNRRDGHCLMAVIPADRRLNLRWLRQDFNLDLELVREEELGTLFPDCEMGAIPPLGQAYRMETYWDDSLDQQPEVYMEAGDHEHLLRLDHVAFQRLFGGLPHGLISGNA